MEKRIIYRTEVSVSNMMLEAEKGMEICSEEVEHFVESRLHFLVGHPACVIADAECCAIESVSK